MSISALILTKNEEEMIGDCIRQLDFVDEIIILDQNSSDSTLNIAKKLGIVNIHKTSEERFDLNRNFLKEAAKSNWLLYIDADERVNNELKSEILKLTQEGKYTAYNFPRRNVILGKWLKHGGWWPDYVPKLFKKEDLLEWKGNVHETPIVKGEFGYAKNPLDHLTARSISKMLAKSIKWAKIEAELHYKFNSGPVNGFKITKAVFKEFLRRYFIKLGVLDGVIGLIQAMYQSLHQAIVLTYLWEIQNKSKQKLKNLKND